MGIRKGVGLLVLMITLFVASDVSALQIDPDFSAGGSLGEPLLHPVYYEFRTTDGISWTDEEKNSARAALSYLNRFFVDQPFFTEKDTPDDFSIRWAGADFFKNYGQGTLNGKPINLNLTGALGVAAKNGLEPPAGWDREKYPLNEIYLNKDYKWHFNPFTQPEEGKPDNDADPSSFTDGEFDFWSILLHEVIHMLCVNYHATHSDEVMFESFSDGERRWELKESDKQLLRNAGYNIVPEPGTWLLLGMGFSGIWVVGRINRRRLGKM